MPRPDFLRLNGPAESPRTCGLRNLSPAECSPRRTGRPRSRPNGFPQARELEGGLPRREAERLTESRTFGISLSQAQKSSTLGRFSQSDGADEPKGYVSCKFEHASGPSIPGLRFTNACCATRKAALYSARISWQLRLSDVERPYRLDNPAARRNLWFMVAHPCSSKFLLVLSKFSILLSSSREVI